VFFVDGSTVDTIRVDLESTIRSIDGHQYDTYEAALTLMSNRSSGTEWLYIIDNADDPDLDLTPYLPNCSHGTVIITSRNRKTRHLASTYHLELGSMLHREAIETLSRAAQKATPLRGKELEQASTLIEELGCLPLAVVQAGIYISEMSSLGENDDSFTFGQYLSLFRRHRERLLRQRGQVALDKYPNGVYAALELSYTRLSGPCRQFLHLCSFLRYSNIAVPMLSGAAQACFEDGFVLLSRDDSHEEVQNRLRHLFCNDGEWDELGFNGVLQSLRSLSLVSISSIYDTLLLRFHPLVHSYARDRLGTEEQVMYKQMAITCISTSYANLPNFAKRHVISHCMHIIDQNGKGQLHPNDLIEFGILMDARGLYEAAEEVYREILDVLEKIEGYEYYNKARISLWLAITLWRQGRLNEAEVLEKEVISIYQENLGPEHLDTMRAVSSLALTYNQQGKWKEAEMLQEQVLTVFQMTLGLDHPDTIRASANLANTFYKQSKQNEAEILTRQVLAMRHKIFGLDHRDTLETSAQLSYILLDQNRFHEAEVLNKQVLATRLRILGPNHPDTINASSGLAKTLNAQGRYQESEVMRRETLILQEKILGKEHPWTISNIHNLAHSIYCQGRAEEALALSLQATRLAEKVLGLDHPYLLIYLRLLVECYLSLGNHVEAIAVRERIARIQEDVRARSELIGSRVKGCPSEGSI
jgi:tetratricopeptide (TPR) repeat protein